MANFRELRYEFGKSLASFQTALGADISYIALVPDTSTRFDIVAQDPQRDLDLGNIAFERLPNYRNIVGKYMGGLTKVRKLENRYY